MAIYGVVGDIHGNLEALSAVLDFLDARRIDRLVCVGDIVGFNANPNECARLVQERAALVVTGNHDLISLRRLGFDRCANKVVHALKRTRRTIDASTAAYLASLPAHLTVEERVLLVHGGLRDVEQYVITLRRVRENAGYMRADFPGRQVCLFGHTHEQKVYELEGDDVRELSVAEPVRLRPDALYFVNPGSVDPSRKREHKLAECAVLDSASWTVEFHSLAYDHALTEAKSSAGGYRIGPWTNRLYAIRRQLIGPREPVE